MIQNDNFIFFYRSANIFSNFYYVKFDYKYIDPITKIKDPYFLRFYSSEQAFMLSKALFFNDQNIALQISASKSPKECKRLGRKVANFDEEAWAEVREQIMYDVNYAKFTQNPTLKQLLMATYPKILVEASPWDKIWGIGMTAEVAINLPSEEWNGENLLGKILTQIRNNLI